MPANLTIRTKLIIILLTLGLIPSLVLGYISLSVSHTALSEQAFNHLISTRDAKKAQIERYFQVCTAHLAIAAQRFSHGPGNGARRGNENANTRRYGP